MRHNNNVVIGSEVSSIEPTDAVLLYLRAEPRAIEQSITLLALFKRKQQPLLLVSDRSGTELVLPVVRSLQDQLLNHFFTDHPRQKVHEIIGIFLQSGLLDLV